MHTEYEVRILEIDPEDIKKRLEKVHAKFEWDHLQKRYVYDFIPKIDGKWIRLRKSNDKIELTVKHIYKKNYSKIQKVKEMEIGVTDLEETNRILESIGLSKRNYQEKRRHSYTYKDAEIEIDEWPMLDPYMEIECDDEDLINEIIDKLNLSNKRIESLNTEALYVEKGIDVLKIGKLKFK